MTEHQADALMEEIEQLTRDAITGYARPQLAALTALCRHRDRVVCEELYNVYFDTEWYGDKTIFDWDLRDVFMEMQT